MTMKRRHFIQTLGASGLLAALSNSIGINLSHAAATNSRVIVIGGGFGGTICAKYIRMFSPATSVTLIEPKKTFYTCPGSNSVISGLRSMKYITHNYDALGSQHGISILHDTVTSVDATAKTVTLKSGSQHSYDYLVVSPGIDFLPGTIEGYDVGDKSFLETWPHAWQAGSQTRLLRDQIQAMEDGGTVIIAPPKRPFRAPPAPYERASLIAYYLQQNKPASKVIILDGNDDFPKQALFNEGWEKLYPGMIEWVSFKDHGGITAFDAGNRKIITGSGTSFTGQVINIIPPQRAGQIARQSGLADASGWCPVKQDTFESKILDHIYVIGDSSQAGDMPKTGHAANSQAKACAAGIIASITDKPRQDITLIMSIYSLLSPKYGISMTEVYRLKDDRITKVNSGSSALGARKKIRRKEAQYAAGWYKSITDDMFK